MQGMVIHREWITPWGVTFLVADEDDFVMDAELLATIAAVAKTKPA